MKQGIKLFTIRRENIVYFSDSEALLTEEGIKHLPMFFTEHFQVVNNKVVLNPGIHFVPINDPFGDTRYDKQVEYTSDEFNGLCVVRTYTDKDYNDINQEIRNTTSSFGYSSAEELYLDSSINFEPIGHSLKFMKQNI